MHVEIHHDSSVKLKQGLKDYIHSEIQNLFEQYVKNVSQDEVNGNVEITHGKNTYTCHIVIHGGHHINLRSDATSDTLSGTFEQAIQKLIHRLKKYKDKMTEFHKRMSEDYEHHNIKKTIVDYDMITDYELDNSFDEQDLLPVVEEKQTRIEHLTPMEAVMKMDLADLPTLCYIDKDTSHVCVVYKRKDGNLSFVDTQMPSSKE